MPDEYLDSLSAKDRSAIWRRLLDQGDDATARLLVAVDEHRAVCGFASYGPANEDAELGELYAMNVDPPHWRSGVGTALLHAVVSGLIEMGFDHAILWTGATNMRAQEFYATYGWAPDGATKTDVALGATVDQKRFRRSLR